MCAFLLLCQIKTNIFFSFRFLCVRALKATISLSQRVATERKKKIDTRPLTIGREERGREKNLPLANSRQSGKQWPPPFAEHVLLLSQQDGIGRAALNGYFAARRRDVAHHPAWNRKWSKLIHQFVWLGTRTTAKGKPPHRGDGADGLLMTGGHLWLELFQFLFPLCPVVSLSLQVRQWRLGAGQPIIKVLHIGVQGAPGRYRLMHSAGNPEIGI